MKKEKLLKIKKEKKAKKPKFHRQDIHKKKRLAKTWRKPRGVDSKKRLRMQRRVIVSPGYGNPKEVRGLHASGLEMVNVSNAQQLSTLDPKKHGIIISGKLGFRKKKSLIEEVLKKEFQILNIKEPKEYIKKRQSALEKKRAKKKEEPKEKKEETKDKEKEESIEDKLSEEEKKKVEKKEIDRLLTKKF